MDAHRAGDVRAHGVVAKPALFHFSDDPAIVEFIPRESRLGEPLVWAIEEAQAWMYCVPRECPRACFWAGPQTCAADVERFLGGERDRKLMYIEERWRARVAGASLWRYALPVDTFRHHDDVAGHWVSQVAVRPIGLELATDLPARIASAGVDLRMLPSLVGLWQEGIASSLVFSGTRLRNCHDAPPEWRA